MLGRLLLFISAFGLSDLFLKNKSFRFKLFAYTLLLIISLYLFDFHLYIIQYLKRSKYIK